MKSFHPELKGVLCLLIGLILFSNIESRAQSKQLVEQIDFQGNRRTTDEELLKTIKTRLGDFYSEKQVQEDLKAVLNLGLFDEKQTTMRTETGMRGGVNIIFEVFELPLVKNVSFDGLKFVSVEEIQKELRRQKVDIEAGIPFKVAQYKQAIYVIRQILARRGFPKAEVLFSVEEISSTGVSIVFNIKEKPEQKYLKIET